jgi:hypothetical protein
MRLTFSVNQMNNNRIDTIFIISLKKEQQLEPFYPYTTHAILIVLSFSFRSQNNIRSLFKLNRYC